MPKQRNILLRCPGPKLQVIMFSVCIMAFSADQHTENNQHVLAHCPIDSITGTSQMAVYKHQSCETAFGLKYVEESSQKAAPCQFETRHSMIRVTSTDSNG
jgi:hypothetical protein